MSGRGRGGSGGKGRRKRLDDTNEKRGNKTGSTYRCGVEDAVHQAGQGVASGGGAIRRAALPADEFIDQVHARMLAVSFPS